MAVVISNPVTLNQLLRVRVLYYRDKCRRLAVKNDTLTADRDGWRELAEDRGRLLQCAYERHSLTEADLRAELQDDYS